MEKQEEASFFFISDLSTKLDCLYERIKLENSTAPSQNKQGD